MAYVNKEYATTLQTALEYAKSSGALKITNKRGGGYSPEFKAFKQRVARLEKKGLRLNKELIDFVVSVATRRETSITQGFDNITTEKLKAVMLSTDKPKKKKKEYKQRKSMIDAQKKEQEKAKQAQEQQQPSQEAEAPTPTYNELMESRIKEIYREFSTQTGSVYEKLGQFVLQLLENPNTHDEVIKLYEKNRLPNPAGDSNAARLQLGYLTDIFSKHKDEYTARVAKNYSQFVDIGLYDEIDDTELEGMP